MKDIKAATYYTTHTLTNIPVDLQPESLMRQAHLEPDSEDAVIFTELVQRGRCIARPKAVYRECFVTARADQAVEIESIRFESAVLSNNLAKVNRVFAYIATCGTEMDAGMPDDRNPLTDFWWDIIKAAALHKAVRFLSDFLVKRYRLGRTSTMAPGSGDASVWPIEQQKNLFALFGDVEKLIGVRLTDSCLMIPNKSVSGIRFQTERDFRTCQLCHRKDCPNRVAPFDAALWATMSR